MPRADPVRRRGPGDLEDVACHGAIGDIVGFAAEFGGDGRREGANTGIDDVHNLACKLASVLSGQSDPRLLDSYDVERRPIADLRHDQLFVRADHKAHLTVPDSDVAVLDDAAIYPGRELASVLGEVAAVK